MWPAGPDGMGAAAPRTAGLGPRGKIDVSGRGAAWLARLTGGQKVGSSNLPGPTESDRGSHAARRINSRWFSEHFRLPNVVEGLDSDLRVRVEDKDRPEATPALEGSSDRAGRRGWETR